MRYEPPLVRCAISYQSTFSSFIIWYQSHLPNHIHDDQPVHGNSPSGDRCYRSGYLRCGSSGDVRWCLKLGTSRAGLVRRDLGEPALTEPHPDESDLGCLRHAHAVLQPTLHPHRQHALAADDGTAAEHPGRPPDGRQHDAPGILL